MDELNTDPLARPSVLFIEEPGHFPLQVVENAVAQPAVEKEEMSPEQKMEEQYKYTQNIRLNVVKELTKSSPVPAEPADKALLSSMLKDMDAQATNRVRIKHESGASAGLAGMSAIVTQILKQVDVRDYRLSEAIDVVAKELPKDMPIPKIVPGEMDVDPTQGNIDEFMKRMHSK